MRLLAFLVLVSPLAAERVTFKTKGGIEIVADYHHVGDDAATVICLPMYRHDRLTYRPLLDPLARAGINALTVDLRGHGESAPALQRYVKSRDPELFNAMHHDVEAAIRFLSEQKRVDTTRLGLVGASVGCSVAVDTAVRNPDKIRAVVLLTPGSYLGVPTLEHLERWPGTSIFVLTSTEEQTKSQGVIDALEPFAAAKTEIVKGKGIHGTRMFSKTKAAESIAAFFEEHLAENPDVAVPRFAKGDARVNTAGFFRATRRLERKVGGSAYTFMLFAVGQVWTLGALVDEAFDGKVVFTVEDAGTHPAEIHLPFSTEKMQVTPEVPAEVGGRKIELKGNHASAGKIHWITVKLGGTWGAAEHRKLSLEFRPAKGEAVRLPAAGSFLAHLESVPPAK